MKLVVISSAPIIKKENENFLYAPYEKEMKLWAKHTNLIQFCCPIWKEDKKLLIAPVSFKMDNVIELKEFDITTFSNTLKAIPLVFTSFIIIFKAMAKADHIHLRCPGNMGLIGSIVQILFPKKKKTAKYAGNWDPNANQPFTYKLQRWILSNTFLTKNIQVLIYGEWLHQTKNIKPFFTATYSKNEILTLNEKNTNLLNKSITQLNTPLKFIFVGTLSKGKQPLYAIQLIEQLIKKGKNVTFDVFGEGEMRNEIEAYIHNKQLEKVVTLKGNQSKETVLKAYQKSHFLILPSKSEGWPKVVAEAMFWGCLPLATPVSCVPYMLDNGKRGIVLKEDLEFDTNQLLETLKNEFMYKNMISEAQKWSRQYTTDTFDSEIQKLINNTI
ncbi:MAG: glycosyltransferase [Flavobacterium sp.]|nr:glycosyltransferase [Flavobacterium sp.]MDP5028634.1 glycosyltransferase [Flavobacterium sp.]